MHSFQHAAAPVCPGWCRQSKRPTRSSSQQPDHDAASCKNANENISCSPGSVPCHATLRNYWDSLKPQGHSSLVQRGWLQAGKEALHAVGIADAGQQAAPRGVALLRGAARPAAACRAVVAGIDAGRQQGLHTHTSSIGLR